MREKKKIQPEIVGYIIGESNSSIPNSNCISSSHRIPMPQQLQDWELSTTIDLVGTLTVKSITFKSVLQLTVFWKKERSKLINILSLPYPGVFKLSKWLCQGL